MIQRRTALGGPGRLASIGVALATALVLAGAAAQLADYGFGLHAAALDSNTDGGVFGLLGNVALASAVLAAVLLARIRPRSELTVALSVLLLFLAVDKALRLHDHVPGWPAYYLPVLFSTVALLLHVGQRLPKPGPELMAAAVLLLGGALILHFTGEAALRVIGAGREGWADQVKGVVKHGAEVEGWLLVALALALPAARRAAGGGFFRRQPHPSA